MPRVCARNIKEEAHSFLFCHLIWSFPQLPPAQRKFLPHSPISVFICSTCLPTVNKACKGAVRDEPKSYDIKLVWYSSLYLFHVEVSVRTSDILFYIQFLLFKYFRIQVLRDFYALGLNRVANFI
jgi:hypothetical protein